MALFSVRMYEATGYEYRLPQSCKGYKELNPDWTTIGFLNIFPFVCATMAFLRTVVDCVLVRYGMFLGNGKSYKGVVVWRPFVFISGVFMIAVGLGTLVMGRAEASMFTRAFGGGTRRADEERGMEEEGRGLIENIDQDEGMDNTVGEIGSGEEREACVEHFDEGDDGQPPTYGEAISTRTKVAK